MNALQTGQHYQDQGAAETLQEANDRIAAARKDTPDFRRNEFRHYIRYVGPWYEWGWILR